MPDPPAPPLGHLPGMYYDFERKRYFPLSMRPTSASDADGDDSDRLDMGGPRSREQLKAISTALLGSMEGIASRAGLQGQNCERKRGRRELCDVNESPGAARRIRRAFGSRLPPAESRVQHRLARSHLSSVAELCQCHGEIVTSIKSYGTGAICMTTDHGKIIWGTEGRDVLSVSVCSQQLLSMHVDVPRGTWVVVSNGTEPHIHSWRRDRENPAQPMMELATADFPHRDIFATSSFDDLTSLASSKSLHTARLSESSIRLSRRRMASDPLALDHASRDLVIAGLRSSAIVMEDLRVYNRQPNVVATLPAGRAVIGVKRLKDSAVPWGIAVSGMNNQLLLFDARFSRQPLLELKGHVNTYHTKLALATSPDDTVVFAGGSDRRLRAWSTVTGERLQPPESSDRRHSALGMHYAYLVQHVDIAEDLTLRVAAAGDVFRFRPDMDGMEGLWTARRLEVQ